MKDAYILVIPIVCAAVVTALKGKAWFALLGVLFGSFWVVGAIRLAKPGSWWYRHRYGDDKRCRSWERHRATIYAPEL